MPFLPTTTVSVSARSLRTQQGGPNTVADPDAFGAGVGRAVGMLGQATDNVADAFRVREDNMKKEDTANRIAMSDFTRQELETRNEVPANGEGYRETIKTKFDNFVLDEANKIPDDKERQLYVKGMNKQWPAISSRSEQFQFTLASEHSKQQTNAALDTLNNKVVTDPTMFDTYVAQGRDVIDSSTNVPASLKESAKQVFTQNSAKARFTGMLERAKSVEEVDGIAAELTGAGNEKMGPDERKDWTKDFAPEDFTRMVNTIGSARKEMLTKADADARAAIDTLESRSKDATVSIPKEEMKLTQELVRQSRNPITISRMARISRDQDIYEETRRLPPAEIRAQINATNGNPGVSYPGLPPRISNAVNKASEAFGVPASYLGATITREYGQFFKRERPQVDAKFAPVGLHKGVDLRNVRQDVVDAASVAGSLFGAPLQITSGFRSAERQNEIRHRGNPNRITVAKDSQHTHGTGLDISTVGMSGEDKGKLTAALADAGFTGFGEYDTHLHADIRNAVPGSFKADNGKVWGGWTNLSPEVGNALIERGFAAGLSADKVKRAAPVKMSDDIDYGMGTTLTKDDGRPASTAVGVGQFTDGTFLQTIKRNGVAQAMGIDINGMSDAQLLELRKDPDVSVMATAALGAYNKNVLEKSLGRTVNDAEMYMAHFLGEGGGLTLIKGYETNGDQSAAALLPKAAASNRPVFYDKSGRPRTVTEVYNRLARENVASPTNVAFGDNETRQRVVEGKEKAIKDDPITEAARSGTYDITPLSQDGGFQARGQSARAVADFYSIPVNEMKPFTQDEMLSLQKQLESGTADKVLEVMSGVQQMGGDVARAGLKQLGETNATYAYAASLQLETGNGTVSGDIVRGEKRMKDNEALKNSIGANPQELGDAFSKTVGGSLFEVSPRERQAIQDAATAHYVETFVARGGGNGFNPDAYGASVQAVLGGSKNTPVLAEVNGEPTVLPRGVTADVMEGALERMTVEDWTRLGSQKLPPRYSDGTVIDPADLADEAKLRSIGGGKYKIQLADDTYAVTGEMRPGGRMEAYVFAPDAKSLQSVVTRPADVAAPVVGETDQPFIDRSTSNALGQFDENGRWLGPAK